MSQSSIDGVFEQLLSEEKLPVVVIDQNSLFIKVNKAFQVAYGWHEEDLLKKSVTTIIPSYLRDAHQIGFSRFMVTEQPSIIGKPLDLEILLKNGTVRNAVHLIVGKKIDNRWQFAASIECK